MIFNPPSRLAVARLGGTADYVDIDASGHMEFVGLAKPWTDLRIEPVARATGPNVPAFEKYFDDVAGTSRGVYLYSFTDETTANQKEIYFSAQMPHEWDGGPIKPHVHWVPAANATGKRPVWGLEYTMKDVGEVFGDTAILYSSTLVPNDADLVAGKHYISPLGTITPTVANDELSAILIGRIFRFSGDASDTYTDKCGLLYIDIHFQLSSVGSDSELEK